MRLHIIVPPRSPTFLFSLSTKWESEKQKERENIRKIKILFKNNWCMNKNIFHSKTLCKVNFSTLEGRWDLPLSRQQQNQLTTSKIFTSKNSMFFLRKNLKIKSRKSQNKHKRESSFNFNRKKTLWYTVSSRQQKPELKIRLVFEKKLNRHKNSVRYCGKTVSNPIKWFIYFFKKYIINCPSFEHQ